MALQKVSDLLRETREAKKLTLEDVENATKIRKSYLKAIEEGRFSRLPSESYALGFVKTYANFLGLPLNRVAALFRRENEAKLVQIVPEFRQKEYRFKKSLFSSPKVIFGIGVISILLIYLFFQYQSLIFGPQLTLESPQDGQAIKGNIVEIRGETDPSAIVTLNSDDELYVGLDGQFRKTIFAANGDNTISVIAKNRFGKETRKEIRIRVE